MQTTHLRVKPPVGTLQFGLGPLGAQFQYTNKEALHGSCCGRAEYWQDEADTNCSSFHGAVKQQF